MLGKPLHRKYRFPEGCSAREIVIRETSGADELAASQLADARPDRTTTFAELVRRSVVSVDGAPVVQPFLLLDQWTSRTRQLLTEAFYRLNQVPEEEQAVFLAAGEDVTPAAATPVADGAEPGAVSEGRTIPTIAR